MAAIEPGDKVGFTGTRDGMTGKQRVDFDQLFRGRRIAEFHHGDCVGADVQAVELVRVCGNAIHSHPPVAEFLRAFTAADVVHDPLPYLDRNQAIVDACDVLVACPSEATEQQRSGTWATIRRARKAGKRVVILEP